MIIYNQKQFPTSIMIIHNRKQFLSIMVIRNQNIKIDIL